MDCSGIAIFDEQGNPIHIESIQTNSKDTHGQRLKVIANRLAQLKEKYPTDIICIERGFTRFNMSTQVIYRVHGVVNFLYADCEQIYYPPKTIKEMIFKGDATKEQIRNEIKKRYPNIEFSKIEVKNKKTKEVIVKENEDESDAFAVGLTYFIKTGKIKWEKTLSITKKTKSKNK